MACAFSGNNGRFASRRDLGNGVPNGGAGGLRGDGSFRGAPLDENINSATGPCGRSCRGRCNGRCRFNGRSNGMGACSNRGVNAAAQAAAQVAAATQPQPYLNGCGARTQNGTISAELYGATGTNAVVCTTCCDPFCGCRQYNIACRNSFWPTFAHPRWLSCDQLYCRRG